nr:uncharacterized protein LOC102084537 isoform X2 [Columba livia]
MGEDSHPSWGCGAQGGCLAENLALERAWSNASGVFHPRSLSPSIKWDEPGDPTAGTARSSAAVQPDSCCSSPPNGSMETSRAALAVLFVAVLCYQVSSSPSSVNFSGPCCVRYSAKAFPSSRVLMYVHTGSHCSQPAVMQPVSGPLY